MNDPDQTAARTAGDHDDLSDRLWTFDELSMINSGPAIDVTAGLVSMRFIRSALRRRRWLWCLTTVLGLLVGMGLFVKFPPAHHATTTVLLVDSPNQDPAQEVMTDVALAESTTVAGNVVRQLGLPQSVPSLLAAYTVTPVTDQVIIIDVSAPSADEAVRRAAAVAKQFLAYRARYTGGQLQQAETQLNGQVTQAQRTLASVRNQISQTSDSSQLASLRDKEKAATDSLAQIRQYVTGNLATLRTAAANMDSGSQVLDTPVAQKPSRLKGGPLYIVGGIIIGCALGMGIVAVGAIISDKLRRRDDIAVTFGAPVRLSVGPLRHGRLRPGPLSPGSSRKDRGSGASGLSASGAGARGSGKTRERDMRRVVDYLRDAIPGSSRGPAGLALVPVDDVPTSAEILVGLVTDAVGRGANVMLADLSEGGLAARRLGVTEPGIHPVDAEGGRFLLVVPDPGDIAPVGPLRSKTSATGSAQASQRLLAAAEPVDLVLTLVTLDPALGSEHLPTWATDAVGIVTAGVNPAAKINAVGELVRLAGTRLDSAVLLDADPGDESLGVLAGSGLAARA